jgi:hypothetical protein
MVRSTAMSSPSRHSTRVEKSFPGTTKAGFAVRRLLYLRL